MRKRVILVLLLLIVLSAAGLLAVAWWTAPTHRISQENIGQIKKGMTKQEVGKILNAPPGYIAPGRLVFLNRVGAPENGPPVVWVGHEIAAVVMFDANDRVVSAEAEEVVAADESMLERLRRWLHL